MNNTSPLLQQHHSIQRHTSFMGSGSIHSAASDLVQAQQGTSQDAYSSLPLVVGRRRKHQESSPDAAAGASPFKFFMNPLSTTIGSIFHSFLPALQALLIPTCSRWLAIDASNTSAHSSRHKLRVTGTFFGRKKGRVSFAVQETPRSDPILVLQLPTLTTHLVKEMASGMVRMVLECDRPNSKKKALWDEPAWTTYCNGHKLGYAISRECTASDIHALRMLQTVSVGAGVMPATTPTLPSPAHHAMKTIEKVKGNYTQPEEIMYMRAKFDRVIATRDSEAFYMINPDCTSSGNFNNGGPELSIFLLRI